MRRSPQYRTRSFVLFVECQASESESIIGHLLFRLESAVQGAKKGKKEPYFVRSRLAIRNVGFLSRQQRIPSSGIRKYYYIFMTALVGFGHVTEKGFLLNNFRTSDFHFTCPSIRSIAECSTRTL